MRKELIRPSGSWVALITPFTKDDRVDMDGFTKLIEFQSKNSTDGVVFMGSTGEAPSLSLDEKKDIIRCMAPYCKGKIPALFGVTCSTTKETVHLAQFAEDQGADGILMVVPPYIIPPQNAIYDFFETVAKSVSISVTIYNNPGRVVANIDPATVSMLADIPNIVADKEAAPGNGQLLGVIGAVDGKINVLCCDSPKFGLILPLLAMGGHGTANVTGNIIPRELAEMSRHWDCWEDVNRSRELFFKYKPLMDLAYSAVNPVSIKAAVGLLGLPAGNPRAPLQPLGGPILEKAKHLIEHFKLREHYDL